MQVNKPVLKKIWSVVSTVIVALVVVCAVLMMGSRILGLQVYNILSDSMTPVYSKGDLIYVKEVDPATLEVGDDVTILLGEDLKKATHRVIANDHENKQIYTQGLANSDPDKPTHYNNVVGKVVFSVPLLGHVSGYIQTPTGTYVTVTACAVLILLVFLPDFVNKKQKKAAVTAPEGTVITVTAAPEEPQAPEETAPEQEK